MKRSLHYLKGCLLAAYVILASCSQVTLEESLIIDQEDQVQFGITDGKTRGALLTNDKLLQMGVFASKYLGDYDPLKDSCNFMYNQLVSKENDNWSYSPVQKWPLIEGLSFFAYAPYTDNAELLSFSPATRKGIPQLTYQAPATITDQIDLLVAEPLFDKYYYQGTVDFVFSHMLSCIDFSASLATGFPTSATMRVTKISVVNMVSKGVLAKESLSQTSYLWQLDESVKSDYILSVSNGALDGKMLSASSQVITSTVNKFMPIPQNLNNQLRLLISTEFTKAGETKEITFENTVPLSQLLPGKRYRINLELNVTQIQVDYEVIDWETQDIDIPPFS